MGGARVRGDHQGRPGHQGGEGVEGQVAGGDRRLREAGGIGDGEGPTVAVVGHIDEIGLVITHIDDKGMIWFESIGGWDPQILVGQRVEIQTKDGPLLGVAGR